MSSAEDNIAWMRRNPDPRYWTKAGARILLDALTATENARDIALESGKSFMFRTGDLYAMLDEARHYLDHTSLCSLSPETPVCDCGFDVLVDKVEDLFKDRDE